ncbi:BA75_03712T0 [Komagataella pastoris]|uniref:BA75_03712T0 n=1 Tax=Komagataella pastoris TaxID=4922 RepID=A0A1B2JGA4_PICPA|nr:BA75_03712T0 [Komagataella pastoris]
MVVEQDLVKYHNELKEFLKRNSPKSRASSHVTQGKEKLLRYSRGQFCELCTDVYDEMRRRNDRTNQEPDHLLPKTTFHPKRNQARKILSSLTFARFTDLVMDTVSEIERRELHLPSKPEEDSEKILKSSQNDEIPAADTSLESVKRDTIDDPVTQDLKNAQLGIRTKNVVPNKTTLAWSSDEEDEDNDDENEVTRGHGFDSISSPIRVDGTTSPQDVQKLSTNRLSDDLNQLDLSSNNASVSIPPRLDVTASPNLNISPAQGVPTLESPQQKSKSIVPEDSPTHIEISQLEKELSAVKEENARLEEALDSFRKNQVASSETDTEIQNLKDTIEKLELENKEKPLLIDSLKNDENTFSLLTEENASLKEKILSLQSELEKNHISNNISTTNSTNEENSESELKRRSNQSTIHEQEVGKWQKRYETLRSTMVAEQISEPVNTDDLEKFFGPQGVISKKAISDLLASVEAFLLILHKDVVDPENLFSGISSVAVNASVIISEVDSISYHKKKKSPLNAAISNAITSVRYYAIYKSIFSKVAVDSAISAILYTTCDLVAILKIQANANASSTLENGAIEDAASSRAEVADHNLSQDSLNVDDDKDTLVRPLKITQRISSNKTSGDILPSPITSNVLGFMSPISTSFGHRAVNSQVSPESEDGTFDVQLERDRLLERATAVDLNQNGNSEPSPHTPKPAYPPASKQLPEISIENPLNGNSQSPDARSSRGSRGSILNRVKQLETASQDIEPEKNKQSFKRSSVDVSDAFNKFGAKRRSVDSNFSSQRNSIDTKSSTRNSVDVNSVSKNPYDSNLNQNSSVAGSDVNALGISVSTANNLPDHVIQESYARPNSIDIDDNTNEVTVNSVEQLKIHSPQKDAKIPGAFESNAQIDEPKKLSSNGGTDHIITPMRLRKIESASSRADSTGQKSLPPSPKQEPEIASDTVRNVLLTPPETAVATEEPVNMHPQQQLEENQEETEIFDVQNFDILNPDNTLKQLLLYLEHQTVDVISTIQTLLKSIKDPDATRGELRMSASAIHKVIDQMTEATNISMSQTRNGQLRAHGSWVVQSLDGCSRRMAALCIFRDDENDSDYADKNFKQRLAGVAFDVARCTKELVKSVEEAKIKDDIAVLDARLTGEHVL